MLRALLFSENVPEFELPAVLFSLPTFHEQKHLDNECVQILKLELDRDK